ncbi:hypothetical protein HYD87_03995 [Mycoplasmopsis bovis]|nr:hypothetical protein [Mycoplasmopsis bovis]QQH36730.1 hypothetical protein HYD87_03995 [Mycoplasmopsis bovis]
MASNNFTFKKKKPEADKQQTNTWWYIKKDNDKNIRKRQNQTVRLIQIKISKEKSETDKTTDTS